MEETRVGEYLGKPPPNSKHRVSHIFPFPFVPAPIPTFILGPNKAEHVQHFLDPEGGELCENITYLGKFI